MQLKQKTCPKQRKEIKANTSYLGIVYESNTSAPVTVTRIGEFIGRMIRLSTSSIRNVVCCFS